MKGHSTFALCLVVLSGCGGGDVPIGETGPTIAIGQWEGYVQSPTKGSMAVRMEITQAAADGLQGVFVYGTAPEPAPPTNGDESYPPGLSCSDAPGAFEAAMPTDGFRYTILSGTFSGVELTVSLDLHELWNAWCELMTPFQWTDTYWSCLPNVANSHGPPCELHEEGEEPEPVDCCKLEVCIDTPEYGICS